MYLIYSMKKILLSTALLALTACGQSTPAEPSEKMTAPDDLGTYENDLYSIHYPSSWTVDEEREGTGGPATGLRTDFYNLSVDVPACPAEMVHVSIMTSGWWDAGLFNDFDDMVHSDAMYNGPDSTLGKWSGDLVKTEIGGKDAYQVDDLGWEVGCAGKDYIVETDTDGHYMTIEVSAGTAAVNDSLVQDMLDSLEFKK